MPALDRQTLLTIVEHTPLVSIDLIIKNEKGEILLGLRTNRPAQGCWFVPGGRVNKDERAADAFRRITKHELNRALELPQAQFVGVFQHLYPDNFAGQDGFGTHYVVLAFELELSIPIQELPEDQHQAYRWWSVDDLLESAQVHENTKAYFRLDGKPAVVVARNR